MKNIDALVLIAVFQEMLGPLLWLLLVTIALGSILFIALLFHERGLQPHRAIQSQAFGLLGGLAALGIMIYVSSSGFPDAGGPIDWLLIAVVFGVGLAGSAVLFYTLAGWISVFRRGAQRRA